MDQVRYVRSRIEEPGSEDADVTRFLELKSGSDSSSLLDSYVPFGRVLFFKNRH